MAVVAYAFTQFANYMATKNVTLGTDSIRVMAVTANATNIIAGQDTVTTMTSLKATSSFAEVANAAGGSSYVYNSNSHLSGLALTTTWTRSNHVWTLTTSTAVQWTTAGAGFAPVGLVFYDDVGATDATNFPICYVDLGGAQAGTGGNWTYTVPASGIMQVTAV